MSMVTVLEGSSSWVPLTTPFTSVVVVKGRGLLQGMQVLSTWDTALVERVEGVTDTKVGIYSKDVKYSATWCDAGQTRRTGQGQQHFPGGQQ